ncbi:MAG TPA: TraM recognition domain-containing protein [Anaeromyxobacteraceae bacterium]|nr:TraM recognition domain-containing protein [Anaeromyxobacteraceae bacterium]
MAREGTGRAGLLTRLLAAAGSLLLALELAHRWQDFPAPGGRIGTGFARLLAPLLAQYRAGRHWALDHVAPTVAATILGLTLILAVYRTVLILWHNEVLARLSGTHFRPEDHSSPVRGVDVLEGIRRRPPGHTFVGLSCRRRPLGRRWEPVYLTERQRSTHRHVLGKTGSGKTQGVLWPQILQDAIDGKGCVVISGKGSDEEIGTIKAIAEMARRERDLRVFALPAWNQPALPSHTYNMVWVDPRSPNDPGGDPVVVAERVFSVLPLGDNRYYNTQAQIMFTNLCRLLHGMVDDDGFGLPFTMRDVAVCLKAIGNRNVKWHSAIEHCLSGSKDQVASREVTSQIDRLGHEIHKALSGLVGAVDKFQAPLVNAYAPDIVIRDVLERNLIVYVQLPANLFKIQAPSLGKVFLMDIQQEGSLRQIFRRTRNQRAFSVVVDEFGRFADLSFVDSLNQLRDANLQFTVAHQSLADLELVSREFANAVWDNTRVKDVLNQDNPALCEMVAKSIGTQQEVFRTVRTQPGPLFTSLATRESSTRLVESYRLHPNRIKNLARFGQGFLYTDSTLSPVCYGQLPLMQASYALPRRMDGERGLRLYERFVARAVEPEPPGRVT